MKPTKFENKASKILSVIGNPFRIKMLLTIGHGEACVCHLEATLKKRQAFISQHLMALRNAGLLKTRREGKFIYYRLADHEIFVLIEMAGKLAGLPENQIPAPTEPGIYQNCACPKCEDKQLIQKDSILSN